jgi:hypothetical protein
MVISGYKNISKINFFSNMLGNLYSSLFEYNRFIIGCLHFLQERGIALVIMPLST